MTQSQELPKLRDVQYICEYFGVHRNTVQKWVRDGKMRKVPGLAHIRVTDQDILDFINADYGHLPKAPSVRHPHPLPSSTESHV